MRLDKFLSQSTGLTRSQAKKVLHAQEVTVNNAVVRDGSVKVDVAHDVVLWAGEELSVATGKRYLMLYKPEGFECTLKAKDHPIVTELIAISQHNKLRIAGRLDVDTTGLLLLSDDGQWLHRVTSPKHIHPKVYEVTLATAMSKAEQADAIKRVAHGILLDNETEKTQPANLVFADTSHAVLTLTEGKYHQVKRMFTALGNHVTALHRSQVGNLTLVGLEKGESRFLTKQEIDQF